VETAGSIEWSPVGPICEKKRLLPPAMMALDHSRRHCNVRALIRPVAPDHPAGVPVDEMHTLEILVGPALLPLLAGAALACR
jgi:hypothetical protein